MTKHNGKESLIGLPDSRHITNGETDLGLTDWVWLETHRVWFGCVKGGDVGNKMDAGVHCLHMAHPISHAAADIGFRTMLIP